MSTTTDIVVWDSGQDAIDRGEIFREPEYQPISIEKVVVVQDKAVMTFVLEDKKSGQKYTLPITKNLIEILRSTM